MPINHDEEQKARRFYENSNKSWRILPMFFTNNHKDIPLKKFMGKHSTVNMIKVERKINKNSNFLSYNGDIIITKW